SLCRRPGRAVPSPDRGLSMNVHPGQPRGPEPLDQLQEWAREWRRLAGQIVDDIVNEDLPTLPEGPPGEKGEDNLYSRIEAMGNGILVLSRQAKLCGVGLPTDALHRFGHLIREWVEEGSVSASKIRKAFARAEYQAHQLEIEAAAMTRLPRGSGDAPRLGAP